VADRMEANRVTYTNWENGKRELRIDQIVELATILNATIDYLTGKVNVNILDIPIDELRKMSPMGIEFMRNELNINIQTILMK